ncbi:MAG: hypothetical protein OXG72_16830 [Acidobacteria bacterium]|nr:hypothetical protein [Acidobacteriota bacterium]
MITKDNAAVLLGVSAIIVTLGMGTCSTNARIDDGFSNVNRRFDDINRRIDDTNRRIDDVQEDVREVRTMLFEMLKNLNPAN